MNTTHRRKKLEERRMKRYPAHGLPHFDDTRAECYSITGTNYEHRPVISFNEARMKLFSDLLHKAVRDTGFEISAWCVMRNHYHLLLNGSNAPKLRNALGQLHGRTSRAWNLEEGHQGRKVWYRVFDRPVFSNRQFYSALNYIHFNPVKDGYCLRMRDWKWSSIHEFIEKVGLEEATEIWRNYPPAGSTFRE